MNIKTPHIVAEEGAFAETVLMPGDPLRAMHIANKYLEHVKEIQSIRGMYAYTGMYKDKKISVMGSGMGVPSMGIYSHELYNFFGVENIIRIGTAGAINDKVKVRDLIIAMGACADSSYIYQQKLSGFFAPIANYGLIKKSEEIAKNLNYDITIGNILTTEEFYKDEIDDYKQWAKMGVLAVEMETAALYLNAAKTGKKALAILTISDEIFTGIQCSAEERQTSLDKMITLALNVGINS